MVMKDLPIDEEKTTIKGKEGTIETDLETAVIDTEKDPVNSVAEMMITIGTKIGIVITQKPTGHARTRTITETKDPEEQTDIPIQMPNQNLNHNIIQQTHLIIP